MTTLPNIRLPGVYFLPPPKAAALDLPPLDVTAFVGYAARGPLHAPVAVEDITTYSAIFGGDLPLAREPGGRIVYANLPRAVAAFFNNGGRRCYVVRVAGEQAGATRFHMPGLVALSDSAEPRLAEIRASSEGRWSGSIRLGTRMQSIPLPVGAFSIVDPLRLQWASGAQPTLQGGDLLRLTFASGQRWLFPIVQAEPVASTRGAYLLTGAKTCRVLSPDEWSAALPLTSARRLTLDGPEALAAYGTLSADQGAFALDLGLPKGTSVQPDDTLLLEANGGTAGAASYLFTVTTVQRKGTPVSPAQEQITVTASEMLCLPDPGLPIESPSTFHRVERLRFDLLMRDGAARLPTISDLAFNAGEPGTEQYVWRMQQVISAQHPRFWGAAALMESSALFQPPSADADGSHTRFTARQFLAMQQDSRSDTWDSESADQVALAGLLAPVDAPTAPGQGGLPPIYLPVGMLSVVTEDDIVGPDAAQVGGDDLATFRPELFLDPYLVPSLDSQPTGDRLMTDAFDRYYTQDRRLQGLHSLLFVDEVALVSLPDAVHPGWNPVPAAPVLSPPLPPILSPPDRSVFDDCVLPPAISPQAPAAPPAATGPNLPLLQPDPFAQPGAFGGFDGIEADPRLAVQEALLRFCEGRRDAVGILALPSAYEKSQCFAWQDALRNRLGLPSSDGAGIEGAQDIADLSFLAVYHPWLLITDQSAPDGLRAVPPDGAVCGMIAARERARQAWIAPANVPIAGVLALTPLISRDDWADLFDRQFNLIRPEPQDFRAMSAHTLSDESDLLQVSVRRLMILLRKVALQRGMDYVFQGNTPQFRAGVRVGLLSILRFMFRNGAFAGRTEADSFQVVTDASVNTPQSVDLGQFIALIQVAPSQPAEFLTVLLTRTGDNLLQATEV